MSRAITCLDCEEIFELPCNSKRCPNCARIRCNKKALDWKNKNKEVLKARRKVYLSANAEKIKEKYTKWYEKNKERVAKKSKQYRLTGKVKKWKDRQISKIGEEAWRARMVAYALKRIAIKKSAMLPSTDMDKVHAIYVQCQQKSSRCRQSYHVDHIIPLSKGGAHHQDNLRIVSANKNRKKHAKLDLTLGGVWADNELAKETKYVIGIRDYE